MNPYMKGLMVCWSQEVMARVAGKKCCAFQGYQLQAQSYLCSFHAWLLSLASPTPSLRRLSIFPFRNFRFRVTRLSSMLSRFSQELASIVGTQTVLQPLLSFHFCMCTCVTATSVVQ